MDLKPSLSAGNDGEDVEKKEGREEGGEKK
jgi:hypothetical protein